MKKAHVTLLFLFLFFNQVIKAQKVDLDREYVEVKYLKLPSNPITNSEERTFTFTSNDNVTENEVKLYGFNRINNGGKITSSIIYQPILIKEVKIKDIIRTEKDKEGKIIKTTKTYQPIINYVTNAYFEYNNPVDNAIKRWDLGETETHKGKEYSKYKEAYNFYKLNENNLRDSFQDTFIKKCISITNKFLNTNFGYVPYSINELFWILDSESNPEYKGHKKALEDIKTLLSKLKEDTDVTSLKPDVEKIVTYFNSVIPSFSKDKKRHRKMRYASYYNSAKLYYQFDMLEKAIEYANKVIENDYDKKDGKRIIKKSSRLKELLDTNKVTTRRFKTETKDSRTFEEPTTITESKIVVIEKKTIPKTKPITSLKLTGNSEIDNKLVENLLDELELILMIKNRRANPFLGKYTKENKRIKGKLFHSPYSYNNRFNSIETIEFNNKIIGIKVSNPSLGDAEFSLVFSDNKMLKEIHEKYASPKTKTNYTYELYRNAQAQIISIKKFYEKNKNKLVEVSDISYKDGNIFLITSDRLRRRDDKTLLKILQNSGKEHFSTVQFLNKKFIPKTDSYKYKKKSDTIVLYNKETTYQTKRPKKTEIFKEIIVYNNNNKTVKVTSSSTRYKDKTGEEIKTSKIDINEYQGNKIVRTIRDLKNHNTNTKSFKIISVLIDLPPRSSTSPEYEWKYGKYQFDYNGELELIKRDGKHKRKKNGVWSDWIITPY